ncbi:MAG: M48 family metallopeptidase [Patescibacteria group bacterium]|nr:M48 family metallopeptidase [Patescibacteria group bacterium]
MPTLYTQSDKNTRNTYILMSVFLIFVIAMGFIFSEVMGSNLILWFAVIFSILMSIGSYWYSDKIVLKMSKARLVEFDDNKELYRLVENLCITAGLPLPKIYLIDDTAPNAFATGRDPEHAVVAVTSGLLQKLNRSELEGVIAHELSHIGNRDILLATVVVVLVGVVALLADFFRNWIWFGGSRRNNDRGGGWLIIVAIILSILAPIFAMLIQLAISRKREFLADADGALLTRYPEGLANALKKISADSEKLEVANRATAHLYFANPFKGKKVSKLLMTHPPVEERIASLMGMPASSGSAKSGDIK